MMDQAQVVSCVLQGDALGDPDLELDSADLDDDMPENISDDAKVKKAKSTKANDITRKADQQNKVKQRADEKAENNGVLAEAADEQGVEAAMQHQNWQVTDEELEGVNVFDLPAPSDSDTSFASIVSSDSDASDSDAKGNAALNAAASTADTVKAAAKARGAAGTSSAADLQGCLHDDNAASGSDADSDLDEAAFMAAAFGGGSDAGGSSEEEAGDDLAGSIDSDEEHLVDTEASTSDGDSDIDEPSDDNPPGPWGREGTVAEAGTAKRGKKSKPKSIFAAAEDYAEQIAELQKQSAGVDALKLHDCDTGSRCHEHSNVSRVFLPNHATLLHSFALICMAKLGLCSIFWNWLICTHVGCTLQAQIPNVEATPARAQVRRVPSALHPTVRMTTQHAQQSSTRVQREGTLARAGSERIGAVLSLHQGCHAALKHCVAGLHLPEAFVLCLVTRQCYIRILRVLRTCRVDARKHLLHCSIMAGTFQCQPMHLYLCGTQKHLVSGPCHHPHSLSDTIS